MASAVNLEFLGAEFLTESLWRFYGQLMPMAYDENKYPVPKLQADLGQKSHILMPSLPK
jgi:hypothetical protein